MFFLQNSAGLWKAKFLIKIIIFFVCDFWGLFFLTIPYLLAAFLMNLLVSHPHPCPLVHRHSAYWAKFFQGNIHCLSSVHVVFGACYRGTCLVLHLKKIQNYSVSLIWSLCVVVERCKGVKTCVPTCLDSPRNGIIDLHVVESPIVYQR